MLIAAEWRQLISGQDLEALLYTTTVIYHEIPRNSVENIRLLHYIHYSAGSQDAGTECCCFMALH